MARGCLESFGSRGLARGHASPITFPALPAETFKRHPIDEIYPAVDMQTRTHVCVRIELPNQDGRLLVQYVRRVHTGGRRLRAR